MTDEIELEFKRFSKDKQEQVRQLVAYTTLMGLSGKDLVSIGGKLDRMEQKRDREQRLTIIKSYDIKPIGLDKTTLSRFKLKINDTLYHFILDYSRVQVINTKTKKSSYHHVSYNDWGHITWQKRDQYQALWELHQGTITLP